MQTSRVTQAHAASVFRRGRLRVRIQLRRQTPLAAWKVPRFHVDRNFNVDRPTDYAQSHIPSSIMSQEQRTYILAPNFRIKPSSGAIALGSIIADPLRAHRSLTTVEDDRLATGYPRIEKFSEYERNITRSESGELSMAVWAQFVQTISAKVSGSHGTTHESNYSMETLETAYFITDPKLEEIESRINVPRIKAIVNPGWLPSQRKPVYMVTGVMVAKGFTANRQRNKEHSGEFEVGVNVPTAGLDVGDNAVRSHNVGDSESWKAGDDIVFAYQLLKIEVKGWKGTRVEYDELRHKAAFLGNEDDDGDVIEDNSVDGVEGVVSTCKARPVDLAGSYNSAELMKSEFEAGRIMIECICAPDNML